MAQERDKSGPRSSGGRKPAAAKSRAKPSAAKPKARAKPTTAKPKTRAKPSAAKTKAKPTTAKPKAKAARSKSSAAARARSSGRRAATSADLSAKSAAELRDALSERLIDPLGLVMLTRERIEEAVQDAVTRGRVTADDAQDLVGGLLERGRKQTNDVLRDLEELLGRSGGVRRRGSDAAQKARRQVEDATSRARKEAAKQVDPVLAQADRARRVAGIGPNFPVLGYDDLTVDQITIRLDMLSPAELRKVRDYERRHGNRKGILSAIETQLA